MRYDEKGKGVGIRREPVYPGERAVEGLRAGEVIAFTETATFQYSHSDGKSYTITFYRLADGRGWVHDFDPKKPEQSALTIIVSTMFESLNY